MRGKAQCIAWSASQCRSLIKNTYFLIATVPSSPDSY